MNKGVYIKNAEADIERLLTNMDRNRGSETYGCLSRPYWHDKITDFPSAHQQIGVLPLTLAYTQDWGGNIFYKEENVRQYINAALKFWTEIQRGNGSFDEHYPNEHSMGAVSWTLWAVTESYLLLRQSGEETPSIEESIEQAVNFLQDYDEPGNIANHQAVAASALINSHRITGKGQEMVEERISRLKEMQSNEGWFQEYVGADIGYQSTSISHIARVWSYDNEIIPKSMIEDSLDFFSNFIDKHNYYSGIIGSRNTQHIHAAGFEILASEFEKAEKIANTVRRNREKGNLLEPSRMDDKHFSRQLAEYMEAFRHAKKQTEGFSQIDSRTYSPLTVVSSGTSRIFINKSKGGIYKKYEDGELVDRDRGLAIKSGSNIYTSNWPGVVENVERGGNKIEIEGELREVPRNTLPNYYFLSSRIFNHTLGRFPSFSLAVKKLLINRLVHSGGKGKTFSRKIKLGSEIETEDEFSGDKIEGPVRSNFVPSSEFFSREDLN